MKTINLVTLVDFMEDFLFAKIDIEEKLIELGKINNRRPFQEFLIHITTNQCMYMHNKSVIPFTVIQGKNHNYLFYTYENKDNNKTFNDMYELLEKIDFDVTKLVKISNLELLDVDLDNDKFFIYDGQYHRV